MPFKSVVAQVYQLALGPVNLWLVADRDELTLIDTGYPHSEQAVLAALAQLGKKPGDIRHILLTHCHPDHVGSLAALKQITGAQAWMHPADAQVVRGKSGKARKINVSPGLVNTILFRLFIHTGAAQTSTTAIEHELQDGDVLPVGGGIRAIHTPGHSQGHTAFLLPQQGEVLLLGDACSNVLGLDYSIVYEDIQLGRASLRKLTTADFQTVCFSHGRALKGPAVRSFRQKWA